MELQFDFDELSICIFDKMDSGLLISGTAELVDAGSDYPGEFYVRAVLLDGGAYLHRDRVKAEAFEAELFKRIEAVICNDKPVPGSIRLTIGQHAAMEWADALAGEKPFVSALRHRRNMPMFEGV
jgi:hypothetical protein